MIGYCHWNFIIQLRYSLAHFHTFSNNFHAFSLPNWKAVQLNYPIFYLAYVRRCTQVFYWQFNHGNYLVVTNYWPYAQICPMARIDSGILASNDSSSFAWVKLALFYFFRFFLLPPARVSGRFVRSFWEDRRRGGRWRLRRWCFWKKLLKSFRTTRGIKIKR